MSSFSVRHLAKIDPSLTRNPSTHKFFLSSCQTKITKQTPTAEGWLNVLKYIKMPIEDYDKSRVLLGTLKDHGDIVVKIGDSKDIRNEYEWSERLKGIKGYVKYICFFECNDNFRNIAPSSQKDVTLCKGEGTQMKVILMPYFPLGSIATFPWQEHPITLFHSCLKHAVLSMVTAFFSLGVIHGDFHIGNVLLKTTKQKSLSYSIPAIDFHDEVPTHGVRTWIMDFEKSDVADMTTPHQTMLTLNYFYIDFSNFFTSLRYTFRTIIDVTSVTYVISYIDKLQLRGNMIKRDNLRQILTLIDGIHFIQHSDSPSVKNRMNR
jgi:hypothetical protein